MRDIEKSADLLNVRNNSMSESTVKIATWNVNSLRVRLPQVLAWLETTQPDILALQELKLPTEAFPHAAFSALGYQVQVAGQKQYNGVAFVSKQPLMPLPRPEELAAHPEARWLEVQWHNLRLLNLYAVNGAALDSPQYAYKLTWYAQVAAYLRRVQDERSPWIVLGDFNITPDDRDIYDPAALAGQLLCSPMERAALQALGLSDLFRYCHPELQAFSWWDYRAAAFRRNQGLRIDLILGNTLAQAACRACHIDRTPRGWERPSDHAPVSAEFIF